MYICKFHGHSCQELSIQNAFKMLLLSQVCTPAKKVQKEDISFGFSSFVIYAFVLMCLVTYGALE
jgi:hypothetical protein